MDVALLVFKIKSWERETEAEKGKRRDGERTGGGQVTNVWGWVGAIHRGRKQQ